MIWLIVWPAISSGGGDDKSTLVMQSFEFAIHRYW